MPNSALASGAPVDPSNHVSGRALYLLAISLGLSALAILAPQPQLRVPALGASATMICLFLVVRALDWLRRKRFPDPTALVSAFAGRDPVPGFLTNSLGMLVFRNEAAKKRFTGTGHETLVRALGELFANPTAVIHRLQAGAEKAGGATEDVVTRSGHVRIAVQRVSDDAFYWRFDEMPERGGGRGAETLTLPVMTIGRNNIILFMNEAARRALGGRMKSVSSIFSGPVPENDVTELNGADGPFRARVVSFSPTAARREVYFLPVSAEQASPDQSLEVLPVALLRLDPSGHVISANALARSLLDAPEGPIYLPDLVEGPGRTLAGWLNEVARGRAGKRSEVVRLKRKDREVFLRITLQKAQSADHTQLVAVIQDTTELKTLEAQFGQGQKMQAIGQLAGGVAHDFNNLLTAISGHCDLLLQRHDTTDPDHADLIQISQNTNRAASLVGQLLAFSRKQTLQPVNLDLREVLSDLVHLLNRLVGERTVLTVSHDPAIQPIRADKRQLEQVIMNLTVNARDAMPKGGEIRIETAMHDLAEDLHRDRAVVPAGRYVLVRVIDKGIGIPPDKRDKIFEPFFTTKNVGEGTGLGLSMAYGIVKQTGGFIFVDSAVGSGTVFTLYFPALSTEDYKSSPAGTEAVLDSLPPVVPPRMPDDGPRPVPPPAAQPTPGAPHSEGVVLLVEDEAPVRAFASRALKMRGFTVLEATSAEEALGALSNPDISVDVFVTDVVMPGMDGPSWVQQALNDRPDTRVVFVSGYAEDTLSDLQERIPNSVFLPKPFSLAELTTTVHGQLH